jgi:hypothetical protein
VEYASRQVRACAAIEAAQEAVEKAQNDYRKGGSPNAVNTANRALAEAHERWREVVGGNVRDRR